MKHLPPLAAVMRALGDADQAHVLDAEILQHRLGRVQLSPAAVEQHQIGPDFTDRSERLRAVADHMRLESLAAQHNCQHLGECRVVVDHQNPWLHSSIVSLLRYSIAD